MVNTIIMSNNTFFNKFMHKDEVFYATQNNPITKKEIWSPTYIDRYYYSLTNNAGNVIDRLIPYDENVRYYPGINLRNIKQTRLQPRHVRARTYMFDHKIQPMELQKARMAIIDEFKDHKPLPLQDLPRPVDEATNQRNMKALISIGRFKFRKVTTKKEDDFDANYWFPDYQGKFTNIATPNTAQVPSPPNNSNFFPPKYLTDRNKASFIWLNVY